MTFTLIDIILLWSLAVASGAALVLAIVGLLVLWLKSCGVDDG